MPHNDRHQLKTDAIVDFGIMAVRTQIKKGESELFCLDCEKEIPQKEGK